MPAGHGVRSRTRDLFSRPFRKKGYIPLTTYLRNYKIGDYVDIKVNGAVHKGMPHKFYHGRTGYVWNVTKRAVGVVLNKQVGNRIINKRLHVRIEHVLPSRCKEEFIERRKRNDALKTEAKKKGEKISIKRQPEGPKPGFVLAGETLTLETVTPIPYDVVNDLKGAIEDALHSFPLVVALKLSVLVKYNSLEYALKLCGLSFASLCWIQPSASAAVHSALRSNG